MAQVAPVYGLPSEGKVVEVDTSGGVLRAYHTKGRWWDEHGRPISVKGWRYPHEAPKVEAQAEHEPEPEEAKVAARRGVGRIGRLTSQRQPADSKSS